MIVKKDVTKNRGVKKGPTNVQASLYKANMFRLVLSIPCVRMLSFPYMRSVTGLVNIFLTTFL